MIQHRSKHQIHVMPHNTGNCTLASDMDVHGRLKNTKEINLQNPQYQHTCCMWQSQLCKRYWMLTHHIVCISRVDGIITEWAEITTTPITYHRPEWTHPRLKRNIACRTLSQNLIQRFPNRLFRHCTHIRNVNTWNFLSQIMWKWSLLTYNEVTKWRNCKIAICYAGGNPRANLCKCCGRVNRRTKLTHHEEFTGDTIGISQDERIIQETKGHALIYARVAVV